ncbi:hypothetical protein [Mycobacterium sp. SMC-4]|uniref:hypothetical protein n=1 Tax=Mycobacterium sp. SMC-4 TaxID=2857059 RepID=UPI003D08E783
MSDRLPPELLSRCQAIADEANQGAALTASDYALLAVVTIAIPALILVFGVLL